MRVTYKTALEIVGHEAIVRQAYKDSVGVWTWGIGVTSQSGHKVERYIGKPQPMKRVLEVYIWLLEERYAPAVRKAFAGIDLSEEQFAAALSFHWNTGAIGRASWVGKFKSGDVTGAKAAFMNWRKPKEILGRRRAERDLFFNGRWSSNGMATEYKTVSNSGLINWQSGVKVDITRALTAALEPVRVDHTPAEPQSSPTGLFAAIMAIIKVIFGGSRT